MKKMIISTALVCTTFLGLAQTGVNNLSFENWTTFGGPAPAGFIGKGVTQMTSGAQNLNSYARLTSNGQPTTSSTSTGAMQLGGIIGVTAYSGAPYALKPLALTGYYKCNLIGSDTVYIAVDLTKNGLSILQSTTNSSIRITANAGTWTFFSIPLTYYGSSTPDSLHIYMAANKSFAGSPAGSAGTTLDVDNFVLLANTTGIRQFEAYDALLSAYPNPAGDNFNIESKTGNAFEVEVYDAKGSFIEKKNFEEQKVTIPVSNYVPGFYFYKISDRENKILKIEKFIVKE
jgi:hypothetical protein